MQWHLQVRRHHKRSPLVGFAIDNSTTPFPPSPPPASCQRSVSVWCFSVCATEQHSSTAEYDRNKQTQHNDTPIRNTTSQQRPNASLFILSFFIEGGCSKGIAAATRNLRSRRHSPPQPLPISFLHAPLFLSTLAKRPV